MGIDLRPQFVERARRRFRDAGFEGRFEVMDLREIDLVDEFHGIFNWFGSFGYFSDSENANLLERYALALRRGGRLLVEQINRERILRHFTKEQPHGDIIRRNEWDESNQRIISHHILAGTRESQNVSSMRMYTPGQMKDLFTNAGLTVETIISFPDGGRLTPSSQRMVVVGRKP
jgi:cyclopropane fatty-acyl-phospholipid synthase-like methyltransferase